MAKVKIKISESQMRFLMENSRIDFLKNQFGFISADEWKELSKKDLSKVKKKKPAEGETESNKKVSIKPLTNPEGELLALVLIEESVYTNPETGEQEVNKKIKVRVGEKVFEDATNADPTPKKVYVQWILKTFTNLIKEGEMEEAIRFVDEDLPQAKENLEVFDKIKNTKLFSDTGSPNDINQYEDLSHLYNAIDPFIEKELGQLESDILKYVKANRAKILYQDSNWMIYQPLDRDANCVMSSTGANWCTARPENTMFKHYTSGDSRYLEPNGRPSKIYVVINKDVFKGKSNEVYQFHFESEQFKDRGNGTNINLYQFFNKHPKLADFFKKILSPLAKEVGGSIQKNHYLKILMAMGEVDDIFDFIDTSSTDIDLSGMQIPKLPNVLGKFKNVETFTASNVGLHELPESIGEMSNLKMLLLSNNHLKSLPESIGRLKNLEVLNIRGNEIKKLPDSFKNLDDSEGGTLFRLSLDKDKFSPTEMEKVKTMLPGVSIS